MVDADVTFFEPLDLKLDECELLNPNAQNHLRKGLNTLNFNLSNYLVNALNL
jgi:hypothetical protein